MKCLLLVFFICTAVTTGFGQAAFLGLKAGVSTKPEVERVLGRPVKQVSPTLIEYAPKQIKLKSENKYVSSGKIFVQYRDVSAAAVAERIEMIICEPIAFGKSDDACDIVAMHREFDPAVENWGGTLDAKITIDEKNGFKMIRYFGTPRYMVRTDLHRRTGGSTVEARWAFYSRELYESIAPTGNCPGTFWGEWETNRGRMTITRIDEFGRFRGTYTENNGSFTGKTSGTNLSGEWKDSTGSGTMFLQGADFEKTFTGSLKRTTGNGPMNETWDGKCVE